MRTFTPALLVALLLTAPTLQADDSHSHSQAAPAQLELNDGKKWETDETLRNGMTQIKKAIEAEIGTIHKNKLPSEKYFELSDKITAELNLIFKNCRLSPKADAMLHLVLLQVIDGTKAMKSAPKIEDRRAGVVKIVGALGQYAKFFDHAGWQPTHH